MPLHRYDLTPSDYQAQPELNRSIPEDFSFGGKIVKGSRLYAWPPFGPKITVPSPAESYGRSTVWNPNGRSVTVGHFNGELCVWSFTGKSFIKLGNAPTLPGIVTDLAFTNDGNFIVASHVDAPYIQMHAVYYTGPGRPAYAPIDGPEDITGDGRAVDWSPDGRFLALASLGSPYLFVYYFNGTTFERITAIDTLPTGACEAVEWSPDGRYLAVGHAISPFLTIYYFNGTTFTKIPDPAVLPSFNGAGTSWSPDGRLLSISGPTTPYFETYEFSNGLLGSKLPQPLTQVSNDAIDIEWAPDGRMIVLAHAGTPYLSVHMFDGMTFGNALTPSTELSTLPSGSCLSISWSPEGKYLSAAGHGAPGISIYSESAGSSSGGAVVELAPGSNIP